MCADALPRIHDRHRCDDRRHRDHHHALHVHGWLVGSVHHRCCPVPDPDRRLRDTAPGRSSVRGIQFDGRPAPAGPAADVSSCVAGWHHVRPLVSDRAHCGKYLRQCRRRQGPALLQRPRRKGSNEGRMADLRSFPDRPYPVRHSSPDRESAVARRHYAAVLRRCHQAR